MASLPPRPLAALCAVSDALDRAGIPWVLTGGAARALSGFGNRPADIDVEVAADDVAAAAAALGTHARGDAGRGRISVRAHALRAGVEIDVSGGLEVRGPGGVLREDFGAQRAWATPVAVAGRTVRLAPLEETLARLLVLGEWNALARIAAQAAGAAPRAPAARSGYLALRLSSARASAAR